MRKAPTSAIEVDADISTLGSMCVIKTERRIYAADEKRAQMKDDREWNKQEENRANAARDFEDSAHD